jgi:hypothetical protein
MGGFEDGPAWFDTVISRVLKAEAAGALWDAVLAVAGTPGFHELKGPGSLISSPSTARRRCRQGAPKPPHRAA